MNQNRWSEAKWVKGLAKHQRTEGGQKPQGPSVENEAKQKIAKGDKTKKAHYRTASRTNMHKIKKHTAFSITLVAVRYTAEQQQQQQSLSIL